jgi:hypothetical protein
MSGACLGMSVESLGLVKLLAVAGGAALGALLSGLVVQILARLLAARKMPRWPLQVVRLLGGIAVGWIVALWVFGGGGSGFGGPGGGLFGLGSGGGGTTQKAANGTGKEEVRKSTRQPLTLSDSLRVEVLSRETLDKIEGSGSLEPTRCYRVETTDGPRLLTFMEVKDFIKRRQKEEPPLRRLVIVLYRDSPAKDKLQVTQLRKWVADLLGEDHVDFDEPGRDAPVR